MSNTNAFTYSQFIQANESILKSTLVEMEKRGEFYRTFRAVLTILQYLPPINFMSSTHDVVFSDIINQKLVGTSVLAYTIRTHHIENLWAVPIGAPHNSRAIFQSIPFYNIIRWYAIYEEQTANAKLIQRGLSLTPNGRIEIQGLPNVTFYRPERQKELFTNDEQMAMALFEISKNCLLFDYCINNKLKKLGMLLSLISGGSILIGHLNQLELMMIVGVIMFGLVAILVLYNNRKYVLSADHMVKNVGYGDAMASALMKINEYHGGGSVMLSKFNIPEQVINIIDMTFYQIQKVFSRLKVNFTPYYKDRVDLLTSDSDNVKGSIFMNNDSEQECLAVMNKLDVLMEKLINNYIAPTL